MKALMVVEGFGDKQYGVERVVEAIALDMVERDVEVHIVTMVVNGAIHDRLKQNVSTVRYWGWIGQVRFHPLQYSEVKALIDGIKPDIVHCHGCLSFLQRSAILAAKRVGCRSILLSAHGMLEPWMWRQKGAAYYRLKRLYWQLIMKPILKQVDYVHAITQQEADTLHREFPDASQVRISNGIDIAEYDRKQTEPDAERYLLYLGRLHPKKGVDLLIEAFHRSFSENMSLVIAGPDFDAAYTQRLKDMVEELDLSDKVSFVGPVYGDEKDALLKHAWCTVVPSYSDVVALVNLESAASFTPTITTTMTGLSDWDEGGGLLVEPDVDSILAAIDEVGGWSLEERMRMGKRARDFVTQRYSWDAIGPQWMDAYRTIEKAGASHG